MSDELRAEVDRLEQFAKDAWACPSHQVAGWIAPLCRNLTAAVAIIRRLLAEHPADDDEHADDDWMRRCGAYFNLSFGAYCSYCRVETGEDTVEIGFGLTADKWRQLFVVQDGWESQVFVKHHPTRGDVRRLCRALQIELKEQA